MTLIGFGSSCTERSERWTEISIHEKDGLYEVEVVGKSSLPGEVDLPRVRRHTTPLALIMGLQYKGTWSRPSRDALDEAAEHDEGIAEHWTPNSI